MTLTVGSLFSGIGGLDLGLERAGMRVIWQSEIDPYACRVLAKHWPEVPNHGDIKRINWGDVVRPDVVCGGYPCQPFSTAGKRNGTDDPRHLWPWVRDAISELRPRYAVLENVRGHLSLGGAEVVGELAAIGYDAEWRVVSAASVGANHRRDRIIIVAYPNHGRFEVSDTGGQSGVALSRRDGPEGRTANLAYADSGGRMDGFAGIFPSETGVDAFGHIGQGCTDVADAVGGRCKQCHEKERGVSVFDSIGSDVAHPEGGDGRDTESHGVFTRRVQTTEPREPGRGIRSIGDWWKTEPDVGRVADGVPHRVDRLRGLGNAVVPQVAEIIGRLVVAHHERNTCSASTS